MNGLLCVSGRSGAARYLSGLPASNDALVVVLLRAQNLQDLPVLAEHRTLAALLAAGNLEASTTNYRRRITQSPALITTDGDTLLGVALADQRWNALGAVNSPQRLGAAVVCYDPVNSVGDDTTVLPLTVHPFFENASGGDVVVPLNDVTDTTWDLAIRDEVRYPTFTLNADWDRGGYTHPLADLADTVDEITIERQFADILPPEVGLVAGYAIATLTATLSGHWQAPTAVAALNPNQDPYADPDEQPGPLAVFSPYRTDSPLWQRPVMHAPLRCDIGFATDEGERFARKFTGYVNHTGCQAAAGEVILGGLDPANRLRAPISLPAVALDKVVLERVGPEHYLSRFNTQWLIDHVLRRNGIHASPPARDDAVLSATCHGAMIPEVGWGGSPEEAFDTTRDSVWTYEGPFGMMAPTEASGTWWVEGPLPAGPGDGIGLSAWMFTGPATGVDRELFTINLSGENWLRIGINNLGRPTAYFKVEPFQQIASYPRPTAATPTGVTSWLFVGVHAAFTATSMTCTFRMRGAAFPDGITYTDTVTLPERTAPWSASPTVTYRTGRRFTNVQVWRSAIPPAAPWLGESWIPEADIDPGANQLTGIPQLNAVDSWSLIRDVVAAELGTVGFDETGRFFFRSRIRPLYDRTAIAETITADGGLADLSTTVDESSVRNNIAMKTTPVLMQDWSYELTAPDSTTYTLGGSSYAIYPLTLPESTYMISRKAFYRYDSQDSWDKRDDAPKCDKDRVRCLVTRVDNPGTIVLEGIDVSLRRTSPYAALLILTNYNTFAVRFATTNQNGGGQVGALDIPIRVVASEPERVDRYLDQNSIDRYGESSYDIDGANQWRQWGPSLAGVANQVLSSTATPVPVLDTIEMPHDPRRTLDQQVIISDPEGLGQVRARLTGIVTRYSTGDDGIVVDQLTARPIGPPGLGLLDDPELGLLDRTLILAP